MKYLPTMLFLIIACTVSAHEPLDEVTQPRYQPEPAWKQQARDAQIQRLEWAQELEQTERLNRQYREQSRNRR